MNVVPFVGTKGCAIALELPSQPWHLQRPLLPAGVSNLSKSSQKGKAKILDTYEHFYAHVYALIFCVFFVFLLGLQCQDKRP